MLILSFRDMAAAKCGAVTSAAAYWLQPITPDSPWSPAPADHLKLATWDEVRAELAGKHVCFLVHGFNVDRDSGYTSLGALAQELEGGGSLADGPLASPGAGLGGPLDLHAADIDVFVPVLWAGDWYLPINYPFLLPDIRKTAEYFAEFIWSAATQMARVSFVTHSMGARVVLETVRKAVAASYRLPAFDTAILAAPAVSDDILDNPDFAATVAAFQNIVVVSSTADTILSGVFPIGNAVEQALWTDDQGSDLALGFSGPRLSSASAARAKTAWYPIPKSVGQTHGDYLPNPLTPDGATLNGWSVKRVKVGELAQAVLDGSAPAWPAAGTINTQT